ncbi:MAG TPA: RluA family pseudouridine synthase [Albitalea sp.]|uniref:RluA family pseudouridine synthase n=1 Tax=Piscinibacter sp. TaxID=1903157 RepID=UPI002ED3523B
MSLPTLFADDTIVVVDKPAGMLSVPGRGEDKADCAARRVQAVHADALVVHRLDMATSGLLLMARGVEAQRRLGIAFAGRRVHKRYVAVVQGLVPEACGEIDLPLIADWPRRPRQKVDPVQGKPSLTRFRVLDTDPSAGTTRVELEPVTGRSHQLRVHLQAIGHPIVGDALYGTAGSRLMLHAAGLRFGHPMSGDEIALRSEAPF